eukprot:TRINITY_DN29232_c0_g1_i6.p1 TRINITY_DN29232_c0_g1~~TRINITY_DN29232_c0_g1_i6.p1  ORF type:complete len:186 (-),score=10.95 TRINITY_DN29232_c0_g1_i6:92-649(-)
MCIRDRWYQRRVHGENMKWWSLIIILYEVLLLIGISELVKSCAIGHQFCEVKFNFLLMPHQIMFRTFPELCKMIAERMSILSSVSEVNEWVCFMGILAIGIMNILLVYLVVKIPMIILQWLYQNIWATIRVLLFISVPVVCIIAICLSLVPSELRDVWRVLFNSCLLYTSPSPRDLSTSRMPSSA